MSAESYTRQEVVQTLRALYALHIPLADLNAAIAEAGGFDHTTYLIDTSDLEMDAASPLTSTVGAALNSLLARVAAARE